MPHLFSESAAWRTTSEFVTPDGHITAARGCSVITVDDAVIENESWADLEGQRRTNNYRITQVTPTSFESQSVNPELGKQVGQFSLDRDTLYSKFRIEDTSLNGFEIIRREGDLCHAQGALYDGDALVNTWTATMTTVPHEASRNA